MVRTPSPVAVRCTDGDPVEFHRRPTSRSDHFLVVEVLERCIEESRWPFLSELPVGGDRCRCWRVRARRSDLPTEQPDEFVLRMRSGPGVWDLRYVSGDGPSNPTGPSDPAADDLAGAVLRLIAQIEICEATATGDGVMETPRDGARQMGADLRLVLAAIPVAGER